MHPIAATVGCTLMSMTCRLQQVLFTQDRQTAQECVSVSAGTAASPAERRCAAAGWQKSMHRCLAQRRNRTLCHAWCRPRPTVAVCLGSGPQARQPASTSVTLAMCKTRQSGHVTLVKVLQQFDRVSTQKIRPEPFLYSKAHPVGS